MSKHVSPEFLASLGDAVAARRAATGLSQVAVAERAGVSRLTYQKLEAGKDAPAFDTLFAVFGALGCRAVLEALPVALSRGPALGGLTARNLKVGARATRRGPAGSSSL